MGVLHNANLPSVPGGYAPLNSGLYVPWAYLKGSSAVVPHGAMGATETFDYGAGPAHSGTYDAALTVTLTGWVAGENILTLDYTTDATGGYGPPTFGAEVVNAADYAGFWDDAALAHNVIVLRTIDSGTNVYIANLPSSQSITDGVVTVDPLTALTVSATGAASVSLTDDGSGAATLTVDASAGSQTFPEFHHISALALPTRTTSFTTLAVDTAQYANVLRSDGAGAQNDRIAWDLLLAAGTYTVELVHKKGTGRGIYSVRIDDSEVGTIDGYNATTVQNVVSDVTGVVVAAGGLHELALKMATKNGSSGGYAGVITAVTIIRTA